jgi:hypothetical protein
MELKEKNFVTNANQRKNTVIMNSGYSVFPRWNQRMLHLRVAPTQTHFRQVFGLALAVVHISIKHTYVHTTATATAQQPP